MVELYPVTAGDIAGSAQMAPIGHTGGPATEGVHLMPGSVVVAGARTPIGKMSGSLAGVSAMELGGFAIAAALERGGVAPEQVDYVFMGHVLQAGQGQITARQE